MEEFKIEETNDYEELARFFMENELEFTEDEPVPTDIVKCWKLTAEEEAGAALAGGIVLAKRQGAFIIDGIAVDERYRKRDLGRLLLEKALAEVRRLSGDCIYLVARAPGFFQKNGFRAVARAGAPNFFECLTCPQYGVSCHPEVMKRAL